MWKKDKETKIEKEEEKEKGEAEVAIEERIYCSEPLQVSKICIMHIYVHVFPKM